MEIMWRSASGAREAPRSWWRCAHAVRSGASLYVESFERAAAESGERTCGRRYGPRGRARGPGAPGRRGAGACTGDRSRTTDRRASSDENRKVSCCRRCGLRTTSSSTPNTGRSHVSRDTRQTVTLPRETLRHHSLLLHARATWYTRAGSSPDCRCPRRDMSSK